MDLDLLRYIFVIAGLQRTTKSHSFLQLVYGTSPFLACLKNNVNCATFIQTPKKVAEKDRFLKYFIPVYSGLLDKKSLQMKKLILPSILM